LIRKVSFCLLEYFALKNEAFVRQGKVAEAHLQAINVSATTVNNGNVRTREV